MVTPFVKILRVKPAPKFFHVVRGNCGKREPSPIYLSSSTAIPRKSNTFVASITILPWVLISLGVLVGAEDIKILVELIAILDVPSVEEEVVSIHIAPGRSALVDSRAHLVSVVADVLRLPRNPVESFLVGVLHEVHSVMLNLHFDDLREPFRGGGKDLFGGIFLRVYVINTISPPCVLVRTPLTMAMIASTILTVLIATMTLTIPLETSILETCILTSLETNFTIVGFEIRRSMGQITIRLIFETTDERHCFLLDLFLLKFHFCIVLGRRVIDAIRPTAEIFGTFLTFASR